MTNAEARFNKIHIRKVYACLAVTCHLHFWQNDRDFLRATAVTRGWNGYRNKSQHRKSTLEKKILPPFQQGFEPATFQSRVRCSNHWAIPAHCRSHCWWGVALGVCPPPPPSRDRGPRQCLFGDSSFRVHTTLGLPPKITFSSSSVLPRP